MILFISANAKNIAYTGSTLLEGVRMDISDKLEVIRIFKITLRGSDLDGEFGKGANQLGDQRKDSKDRSGAGLEEREGSNGSDTGSSEVTHLE